MNAEFSEKYIVVSSSTAGDKITYSTEPVRKNLAPISFIGATVININNKEAYPVDSCIEENDGIKIVAGRYILKYTPETGSFDVTVASSDGGGGETVVIALTQEEASLLLDIAKGD